MLDLFLLYYFIDTKVEKIGTYKEYPGNGSFTVYRRRLGGTHLFHRLTFDLYEVLPNIN